MFAIDRWPFRLPYHGQLALGLCLASLSAPALQAQAREDHPEQAIIVTGSRIRAAKPAQAEPLVVVPGARVAERNLTHFADALNETPGFRGSVTPNGAQAQFGQGMNFINAFGLGSNRTLVLVDGKRMPGSNAPSIFSAAAPGAQVDLNAVPDILVDRVEMLSIGGAPAYGSDAIAATVNLRLRRAITGVELRALSGISEQGDNFRRKLAGAAGRDFAGGRGHVTIAASMDRTGAVASADRAAYRANLGNATNPCSVFQAGLCTSVGTLAVLEPAGRSPATDGRVNPAIGFNDSASDGNPASVLIRDLRLAAVTTGGVLSSGQGAYNYRFAPDGTLVPYARGTLFGAPLSGPLAAAAIASGGDGFTLLDRTALTSRLERINGAALLSYELTDRLRLTAEGMAYHGEAAKPVDLPTFNSVQFTGASGALTFRTDNPLLSAQARQTLAALGYGQTFQISRANTDLADRSGSTRTRVWRAAFGLEGKAAIGGRDYDFALSLVHGRSRTVDFGEAIDQQRFVNAINVALVNGVVACSSTPTVTGLPAGAAPVADPACAPLNLFGDGAPSAAALAYVIRKTHAVSTLEQTVASGDFGGSPFSLFGNPVSFNLGFEHRKERARFAPDAFLEAGLGRSTAIAPVAGRYKLDEQFGEVLLPLITPANHAPIHALSAFARVRRVDNSVNGAFTAWSAGGALAPVADVELRGNFTRSFRSPAVLELFSPRVGTNLAVPDLCSPANVNAGPVPALRAANCAAFLQRYPAASPLRAATTSVPALTGGNPGLRNERADSFTLGTVLRPRLLPGLTITADYLDITIRNPIARLGVAEIAQGCFDNPDFNAADPARGNAFCALIARDADGQVIADAANPAVTTGYVNGKRIHFAGVQASLDYRTDLSALGLSGALSVGGALFHVRRRLVDLTGVAPTRSDGLVGDPRWQGQVRLRYADEHWGTGIHVNLTGRQAIARDNRGDAPNDVREFDHFRGFATVDLSLFAVVAGATRMTFAVTNLFDRMGQRYNGYIVPASINDALGRRLSLSLSLSM